MWMKSSMGNGNNAPSQTPMLLMGGLVLLLILCCISIIVSYSRVGNINIFSGSSREFSAEELAYAQAHGGAMPPGSSSSSGGFNAASGLLDAFGVKQMCKVGPWSDWSACDANCGSQARRRRTRQIITPAKNGGSCLDPLVEDEVCTGLPPCEVPALTAQYEPCPGDSYLEGASCIVNVPRVSDAECERIKQQAVLNAISFGAAGSGADQDVNAAAGAATAAAGTIAIAAAGYYAGAAAAGTAAGATLLVAGGIMAAVAAGEADCDAYICPPGWRDTHVLRRCDLDAVPKCPPGEYKWNKERGMCIMASSPGPAPSPY